MVRLSKIYTRSGDDGTTGLVGGDRIAKTALRLEAYGTVDELNSFIGLLRTFAAQSDEAELRSTASEVLRQIQNDLFDIGSLLATAPGSQWEGMRTWSDDHIQFLEEAMDDYNKTLSPLPSFVLPGGGLLNAHAHIARTVCRRCERLLWHLNEEEPVNEFILKYMNRLSDFLFVFSRWVAKKNGEEEYLWESSVSLEEGQDSST